MSSRKLVEILSATVPFTPDQIINFITFFNRTEKIPFEFWAGFKSALVNGTIDPNLFLVRLFDYPIVNKHILIVGMCLRYGGNPNMYVTVDALKKTVHIVSLIYFKMKKSGSLQYIDTIILLFILRSDVLEHLVEDPQGGRIRKEIEYSFTQNNTMNVGEYLLSQGYSIIKEYQDHGIMNVVPIKTLILANIILDNVSKFDTSDYNFYIIKSLGDKISEKLPISQEHHLWNSQDLYDSYKFLNLSTFKLLLRRGQLPSYPMMNEMILRAKTFSINGIQFGKDVMYEMILESVKAGYKIDIDQNTLISQIVNVDGSPDDIFFDKVQVAFDQPGWKKVCNYQDKTDDIPLKLRELGIALGISTSNKKEICDELEKLTERDRNETIAKFRHKNSAYLLGYQCDNRSVLADDPENYSDLEITHYKDHRGGKWCFTSDMYEGLLQQRVNIYTLERLPANVILELQRKMDILKELGIPLHSRSLSTRLGGIWDIDTIEDNVKSIERAQKVLQDRGIDVNRFNNLKADQVDTLIENIYGVRTNLRKLTPRHFKITFVWMADWLYVNQKDAYERLIDLF